MNRQEFTLRIGAHTHTGKVRAGNEDSILAADPCFLVADGVGGQEAGAQASSAAVEVFQEMLPAGNPARLEDIERALSDARQAVRGIATAGGRGAGSTLTGVIRVDHDGIPQWYVLNIGDSRVYLHRDAELLQLTTDHSLQEELGAAGDPAAELAPKNVITRALGGDDDRHDSWLLPLESGSRVLVCSDGLTSEVGDEQIRGVLTEEPVAERAADELLRRALMEGGRDNVSVIVVDVGTLAVPAEVEETGTTIEQEYPKGTR